MPAAACLASAAGAVAFFAAPRAVDSAVRVRVGFLLVSLLVSLFGSLMDTALPGTAPANAVVPHEVHNSRRGEGP